MPRPAFCSTIPNHYAKSYYRQFLVLLFVVGVFVLGARSQIGRDLINDLPMLVGIFYTSPGLTLPS
jgi:hypothetical protein